MKYLMFQYLVDDYGQISSISLQVYFGVAIFTLWLASIIAFDEGIKLKTRLSIAIVGLVWLLMGLPVGLYSVNQTDIATYGTEQQKANLKRCSDLAPEVAQRNLDYLMYACKKSTIEFRLIN